MHPSPGPGPAPEPQEVAKHTVRQIHLDMATVMMASAGANLEDAVQTTYASNGRDPGRIRRVLGAGCKCTSACRASVKQEELEVFCNSWHALPAECQARLLQVCYENAGNNSGGSSGPEQRADGKRAVTEWYLLGNRVSKDCLVAMLGTTSRTLFKHCHGQADGRSGPAAKMPRTRPNSAALIIDQYFQEVYWSAAEPLPETLHIDGVDEAIERGHISEAQRSKLDDADALFADVGVIPEWNPNDVAADVMARSVNAGSLKARHVQHGHMRDLWWRFLAWCAALPQVVRAGNSDSQTAETQFTVPSFSSFWRRWHDKWRALIRFRGQTQHSQCATCFKFTSILQRSNASTEAKRAAADQWQHHLMCSYKDRLIYWYLRWSSRCQESRILCIITDSMDKAKSAWPQWGFRTPKTLDSFRRPKLVITASVAHGFAGCLLLSHDEQAPHGASAFCEVLSRTIEKVKRICVEKRFLFPNQLVVQVDNTTAQAKNHEAVLFLASLVGRGHFASVVLNTMTVGHTHEDVDFLFSLVYSKVLRRFHFAIPDDLLDQLQVALGSHFKAKGEVCSVEFMTHVHDFGTMLAPLGVALSGAFNPRGGVDVPHSFILKRRCDFSAQERLQAATSPRVSGLAEHEQLPQPHDVFCLTKQFMHSEATSSPLLVLPSNRMRLVARGPTEQKLKDPMVAKRCDHLRQLANVLERLTQEWSPSFSLFRAAAELRRFADGVQPHPAVHAWLWADVEQDTALPQTRNRLFNNHPEMVWPLMAKFFDAGP